MPTRAVSLAVLLSLALCGCGGDSAPAPGSPLLPTPQPTAASASVPAAWSDWLQAHAHPLRSSDPRDSDFSDLQFLKAAIGDRRLVQLGESGHGVAEFDAVKVRLIRFLHEQMGFEVIAFESGLFECFHADQQADALSADQVMKRSIFGVWHTEETLPLFEYLKGSRSTNRPLTLAGFDTQFSSGAASDRPGQFRDLLTPLDAEAARQAFELDEEFIRVARQSQEAARNTLKQEGDRIAAGYRGLAERIGSEQRALEALFPARPLWPRLMRRAAEAAPVNVACLRSDSLTVYGNLRDLGMADNIGFLLAELYPDKKIVVWAHNGHVQHDPSAMPGDGRDNRNMGSYLAERHRADLYTVGLFMGRGTAAQNDRTIYQLTAPLPNSLEALFGRSGLPLAFVDLLGQERSEGTAWMFDEIAAKDWGRHDIRMVPRNQYDAILFVDQVHPPHYR